MRKLIALIMAVSFFDCLALTDADRKALEAEKTSLLAARLSPKVRTKANVRIAEIDSLLAGVAAPTPAVVPPVPPLVRPAPASPRSQMAAMGPEVASEATRKSGAPVPPPLPPAPPAPPAVFGAPEGIPPAPPAPPAVFGAPEGIPPAPPAPPAPVPFGVTPPAEPPAAEPPAAAAPQKKPSLKSAARAVSFDQDLRERLKKRRTAIEAPESESDEE